MATPVNVDQPVLEVHPNFIKFKFVPDTDIAVEIQLKNLTQDPVMYKVKTTAPDCYQVRPIVSVVDPHKTDACVIVLRAMAKPPKDLRHKFLVQSAVYNPSLGEEGAELSALWRVLESAHKKVDGKPTYHDQRFTCQIVVPDPAEAGDQVKTLQNELAQLRKQHDELIQHSLGLNTNNKDLKNHLTDINKEREVLQGTVAQLEREIDTIKANAAKSSIMVPGAVVVNDGNGKQFTLSLWQIVVIAVIAFLLGAIIF